MREDEIMLKANNVSKVYKLGEIGGTTLKETLQRLGAKMRGKADPTKKIGAKNYNKGEKFTALNNVSFEIKKGERVGIIGHNGAGKSTLLKLISRVTGPTSGEIYLNGRVTSMLEVGTGFHPELTGRENIYMNGAILGMSKKEIDAKMEDIIEFSEVRQFIDTPVKRYSSGMYVKLAFSVAAHLVSEIMIMDEVLAVGDMAFQSKCLNKMKDVSNQEKRTILYVSHNMSTIRQLCNRVIVLDKGHIVFDGDVEEGISLYLKGPKKGSNVIDVSHIERLKTFTQYIFTKQIIFVDKDIPIYESGERVNIDLLCSANKKLDNVFLRLTISYAPNCPVGAEFIKLGDFDSNIEYTTHISFSTEHLAPANYFLTYEFYSVNEDGSMTYLDFLHDLSAFEVFNNSIKKWNSSWWGYINYFDLKAINEK